jgi:16S rRNA (adenine1518-N6/adenine1519-N6)-dimethyltransferase
VLVGCRRATGPELVSVGPRGAARSKVGARPSGSSSNRAPRRRPVDVHPTSPSPSASRKKVSLTPHSPGSPSAILHRFGLSARKSLSQSFLTDERICEMMADAAELSSADEVLEIGPGLGILTRALLARARRVVAVELDRALADHLATLTPGGCLEVVQGDALSFEPSDYFPNPYKLVANLPYQISTSVLTRYLTQVRRPDVLVLMLQREVAERIAAPPGRASYLSILVQSLAEVRILRLVPPGAFYPRPRVTSSVVRIAPMQEPLVSDALLPSFLHLVRAGFTQPRKTLANSLAQGLDLPRAAVERRLIAAGLDPALRPQTLTVADWLALLRPETRS